MSIVKYTRLMSQSLATQAISSLTSFVLAIYLVRSVPLEQFGWYNMAFAAAVFVAGIGNAIVITQLVVTLPGLPVEVREAYVQRMALFAILIAGGVLLLSVVAGLVSLLIGGIESAGVGLAVSTSVFAVGLIVRDLVWRYAFAIDRGAVAVVTATICLAILGLLGLLLNYLEQTVTASEVLIVYGVVLASLAAVAMRALRMLPVRLSWTLLVNDIGAAWSNGRWAVLSHGVSLLRSQSYNFVVIAFAGASAVGVINAVRLMFVPAIVALPAVSNALLPGLARLAAEDACLMRRRAHLYASFLMSVAVVYGGIVLVAYDGLRNRLLGGGPWSDTYLRYLWAIYGVLLAGRASYELSAQAAKAFRQISLASAISAIVTLTLAVGLAIAFDAEGAMAALLFGEMLLMFLLQRHAASASRRRIE